MVCFLACFIIRSVFFFGLQEGHRYNKTVRLPPSNRMDIDDADEDCSTCPRVAKSSVKWSGQQTWPRPRAHLNAPARVKQSKYFALPRCSPLSRNSLGMSSSCDAIHQNLASLLRFPP